MRDDKLLRPECRVTGARGGSECNNIWCNFAEEPSGGLHKAPN
jgi:hypothetical protein